MSEVDDILAGQQFARELRRVREVAGLTMDQMATRLGMGYTPGGRRVSTGRAAVSAWEAGKRRPPPEYLKAYIEQGGNPLILTERPKLAALPGDVSVPETPKVLKARRRRWLAAATTVSMLGGALAIYLSTRHHVSASPKGPASTWTETTGTPAHTWADPVQLTGAGAPLGPRQSIQVTCRVRGYVVQDGDPWWYLVASTPWNDRYYATSDAFYNNGATTGPVDTGVVVDEQVPVCPNTPAVATAG